MKITLPFSQEDYVNLLLQRTDFLVKNRFGNIISEWTKTGSTEGFEKLISDKSFMQKYIQDCLESCQSEALNIVSHAKEVKCNGESLLSIGCGNAIIEMFVAKQIQPSIIYLFDIEQTPGKHHHGINENGAGYASLQTASNFLKANLDYRPVIVPVNPLHQNLPSIKIDMTISLLSAGFHYSMNQYRKFLTSSTLPGGILIFDERKNAPPGFKFDCDDFTNLKPCSIGKKHERKLMIKKQIFS